MEDKGEEVLNKLTELRSLLAQGYKAELDEDSSTALNIYTSAINIIAEVIDVMKSPPFSAPDSVDNLSNIALYFGGRIRLLGLKARDPKAGIERLVESDARTVLQDLRDTFQRIKDKVNDTSDITTNTSIGTFTRKEDLAGYETLFGNEDIIKKLKSYKRSSNRKATLLYGPPGSGKTSFAKAQAKFLNLNFRLVDVSQVLSKWVGGTEQNIAALFKQINERDDELVLLDECEQLIIDRGLADTSNAVTTVNTFLVEFERMKYPSHMILTTNYANRVDKAIMRRLNAIFIPYPVTLEDSWLVFQRILGSYFTEDITVDDMQVIKEAFASRVNGQYFSPADFAGAIDEAVQAQYEDDPLRVRCGLEMLGSMTNKRKDAKQGVYCMIDPNGEIASDEDEIIPRPLSREDIFKIVSSLQPNITPEQYQAYTAI